MATELRGYEFNRFIDKVNGLIENKQFIEAKISFDTNRCDVTIFVNNLYWLDFIKFKDPGDNAWAFEIELRCLGTVSNRLLLKQTVYKKEELQPAPFAYSEVAEVFYDAFAAVSDEDALKAFLN